jgi:hypothetical protein
LSAEAWWKPTDPKPVIRVCQFHIIQAIGRADFYASTSEDGELDGSKKSKAKRNKKVSVGLDPRSDIAYAFRRIQRYRSDDPRPWEDWVSEFDDAIRAICDKHGISDASQIIIDYFDRNWFSPYWRGVYLN